MIIFNVVKEEHGWAVKMADHMTTPFWSRELAVLEANALAKGIRCHGQRAEVTIQSEVLVKANPAIRSIAGSRPHPFSWRRRAGVR